MRGPRSSRTALGAAFCRLVEQGQAVGSRLFDDPVVASLLDPGVVTMAGTGSMQRDFLESLAPGTYGSIVMRTRYIDDVVIAWADSGQTQLVILGAGLDTRAHRMTCLAGTTVFEADLPDIQADKRKRLRGVQPRAAAVRYVPIDFATGSLRDALSAAGFDAARPALFVWEGVTQYLSDSAVRSTLAFVAGSAPGSMLVFTYVLSAMVGTGSRRDWSGALEQQFANEPWIFGLDPDGVAPYLDTFGLALVDHVGIPEYQERYLDPIGRRLAIGSGERVALAGIAPTEHPGR